MLSVVNVQLETGKALIGSKICKPQRRHAAGAYVEMKGMGKERRAPRARRKPGAACRVKRGDQLAPVRRVKAPWHLRHGIGSFAV
ncbi:MAG: hypothetical protein J7516_02035 [Shinella sp.]|nr:hypothetical protein [Shinella sp.]